MISFATDTVTAVHPAWITDHGSQVADWDNATTDDVTGCRMQPRTGAEILDHRDAVTSRWLLMAPAGSPIYPRDRIRWRDDDYDIEGYPQDQPSPTGDLDHMEIPLVRTEG